MEFNYQGMEIKKKKKERAATYKLRNLMNGKAPCH